MKNTKKFTSALITIILQYGCVGVAYEKKLNDSYFLSAMDTNSDMEIIKVDSSGSSFVVVPPRVVAVGYDTSYVIAKQYIENPKQNVNYFVVKIGKSLPKDQVDQVVGPLNNEQFIQLRARLNIRTSF